MEDKRLLRASVLAARAADPARDRADAGARIARHGQEPCRGARVVAGYAAVGTEPPTRPLLDRLRTDGIRVLLPVVTGVDLAWGDYTGWDDLRPGEHAVLEPEPVLTPDEAAALADVCLVPALAVDRQGHRLGRGAGYFDRWLARVRSGREIVAVVYSREVVDDVPHEPHDVLVSAALTPDGVVRTPHGA